MLGRALTLGVSFIAGCAAPSPAEDKPPAAVAPPAVVSEATEPPRAPIASSSAAPPECLGPDKRLYGSTCCRVTRATPETRFPGQVFLSCVGPQIGKACTSKGDCDLACSCDGDVLLDPRDDRNGPKDGTKGVTGACSGRRQAGVWMCDIDESGAVRHMIVD